MKKRSLILVSLCLVVVLLCFFIEKKCNVEKFNMLDYANEIETYSNNKTVGEITDKKTATQIAKELWCDEYNFLEQNAVNTEEVNVLYDDKNDCWHIYGVIPQKFDGASPHALIKSSGEVLSVWIA